MTCGSIADKWQSGFDLYTMLPLQSIPVSLLDYFVLLCVFSHVASVSTMLLFSRNTWFVCGYILESGGRVEMCLFLLFQCMSLSEDQQRLSLDQFILKKEQQSYVGHDDNRSPIENHKVNLQIKSSLKPQNIFL